MDAPANPTLPLRRIVQGRNPRTYFDPAEMAVTHDQGASR